MDTIGLIILQTSHLLFHIDIKQEDTKDTPRRLPIIFSQAILTPDFQCNPALTRWLLLVFSILVVSFIPGFYSGGMLKA